jgi:hypothetical protein
MATTEKVARSKSPGNEAANARAEVLQEVLDKAERAAEAEQEESRRRVARREAQAATVVPLMLQEICDVIGHDVAPDSFAVDALRVIGDQIDTLAGLVESEASSDSWRLFRNLAARAELASRVAYWIDQGKLAAGPSAEVQP